MLFRCAAGMVVAFFAVTSVHAQPAAKGRVDALGDPLPNGAIIRLGTTRMRHEVASNPVPVRFSLDGKKVISSGPSGSKAWDAVTGKPSNTFTTGESWPANITAISESGNLLLTNQDDNVIDATTGKRIGKIPTKLRREECWAFSQKREIVSVNEFGDVEWFNIAQNKNVRSWNCLTGLKKPKNIDSPLNRVFIAALSPDTRVLLTRLGHHFENATGYGQIADPLVVAWDTLSGEELWRRSKIDIPLHFAFSPDGRWLTYSTDSEFFHVCDPSTGKDYVRVSQTLLGLHRSTASWALGRDGKTLAVAHEDFEVIIWDLTGPKIINKLNLKPGLVSQGCVVRQSGLALSPDGRSLLAATDNHVQLLEVATGKQRFIWDGHRDPVSCLAFAADGRTLITGSRRDNSRFFTDELLTWDLATGKSVSRSDAYDLQKKFNLVSISALHTLGIAVEQENAFVVDLGNGKKLRKLQGPTNADFVRGQISPHGRFVILPSARDQRPIIATHGDIIALDLPALISPPSSSVFSADESLYAWQQLNGLIHIVNTATGKQQQRFGSTWDSASTVQKTPAMAFSADNKFLASVNLSTGALHIWEISRGRECQRLVGKTDGGAACYTFCWSPDSRMLADAGIAGKNTIRIWETATGKLRREFTGHEGEIHSLAFSPDSRLLASGSADTTVLIWDLMAKASVEP